MKNNLRIHSLWAMLVLAILALPAAADDTLDQAQGYIVAGKAEQAYTLLAPLNDAHAGEPAFDYLLGRACLDSGRLTEAVFALERVVAVQPDNQQARAELARAHFQMHELDEAKRQFAKVDPSSAPPEAKAAIQRYLDVLDIGFVERPQAKGYISLTMGFDTNINSGTGERFAQPNPGLAPAEIPRSGRETEGWFGTLAGGGSYIYSLSANTAIIANGALSSTLLDHFHNVETSSLSANAGLRHRRGPDSYTGAALLNVVRSGHRAYLNTAGLTVQYTHTPDSTQQFSFYGQLTDNDYIGTNKIDRERSRDSERFVAGGGYSRIFAGPYHPVAYVNAYAGNNNSKAAGRDFLDYKLLGVRGGGRLRLDQAWSAYLALSVEQRQYDDANAPGGFTYQRRDREYGLTLGANYVPFKNWSLRPQVSFNRNDSKIVFNDYERSTISLTLSRDFQ